MGHKIVLEMCYETALMECSAIPADRLLFLFDLLLWLEEPVESCPWGREELMGGDDSSLLPIGPEDERDYYGGVHAAGVLRKRFGLDVYKVERVSGRGYFYWKDDYAEPGDFCRNDLHLILEDSRVALGHTCIDVSSVLGPLLGRLGGCVPDKAGKLDEAGCEIMRQLHDPLARLIVAVARGEFTVNDLHLLQDHRDEGGEGEDK